MPLLWSSFGLPSHIVCVAFTFLLQGPPKYTKAILKKGDKTNFPKKGDTVSCWYTGSLEDGTVFDTNVVTGSLPLVAIFLREVSPLSLQLYLFPFASLIQQQRRRSRLNL